MKNMKPEEDLKPKFECHICRKILQSRRNLDKHIENHMTCKTCKQSFNSEKECKDHEMIHTFCTICDIDFVFPSKLTRHNKQKHS